MNALILGEQSVVPIKANINTVNQDLRKNLTMRLLDALTLGKQPAPPIRANTNIVNQNSRENYTIRLLGTSILGEQPTSPIRANTDGKVLQQDNPDICNNDKPSEYPR